MSVALAATAYGLVVLTCAAASPSTASVSGTVKLQNGDPVADVVVTLETGGTVLASSTTAPDGSFSVPTDPGTYDIRFTPPTASGLAVFVYRDFEIAGIETLNVVLIPPGTTTTTHFSGTLTDDLGHPLGSQGL